MTNEGTDLDTILNGATDEPAAEAVAVVETPQEQPEVEARPRNPDGTFASKGETASTEEPSASPAPETTEPTLEHPALIGERRRRQQAEQERDELRQALAKHKPAEQQQAAPAEAPDPWEDPHGFANWTSQQAVAAAMQNLTPVIEQRFVAERVQSSVAAAKVRHSDFDEKWAVFEAMEATNPALTQAALQQPDPAEYVYRTVKNYELAQQLGALDVDTLKARLREEIMAEETAKLPQRPSIPSSLASERNVGSRSGPAWAGPKSLAEILN